ncbi:MAG: GHKL domain-containing protein [Gammaproteobacteria bacterium]|jgi:signal transduction histidine kinase|nr:GHKL domain-containing protein [Gammaproteobacteria bacterium]
MKSIQTRLVGGLIISLILFLIVQWLLIGTSIRYLSEAYIATRLEHDAESLLTALDFTTQPVSFDADHVGAIYKQPFSGHYFRIKTGVSEFRSRSLWDTNMPLMELKSGQSQLTRWQGPQQQKVLVFHTAYMAAQHQVLISVAEDLTPILRDIETFQVRHTEITVVILAVLVLIQAYIVRVSLKPLDAVRRELESLEKGVINQLNENVPLEIRPLVEELNFQLKAIKKRLERSRNATGNLAHSLKTPLTLIQQLAESDELAQMPEVRRKLLLHSQSIQHSIERELKRARMAGSNVSGRHIALLPEISDLQKTLAAMYRRKNIATNINVPQETVCAIERQDLLEILGNVLDNAYKWASHRINVTVTQQQDRETLIIIEDDGPGCEADYMEKLLHRGRRADEQVAGHGLGLSIVSELVEDYQGSISFSHSEALGGLQVCIRFPKT